MMWSLRKAVVAKAINAKPVVVATKVDTITAKAISVQVRMAAVKVVSAKTLALSAKGSRLGQIQPIYLFSI